MSNVCIVKGFTAGGAIAAFRIVKPGSNDGEVVQAAGATDSLIGVCESVGPASGERCDVIQVGIADVEFGGSVTRGGPVTADSNGKAVAAAPATGANARVIGYAQVSAASGDIAPILLAPGVMQGA